MIITKLAGLFTSWIDIEKRVYNWTQYKCSRCSVCHTRGVGVGICEHVWVGLSLFTDKEASQFPPVSDDQSVVHYGMIGILDFLQWKLQGPDN